MKVAPLDRTVVKKDDIINFWMTQVPALGPVLVGNPRVRRSWDLTEALLRSQVF